MKKYGAVDVTQNEIIWINAQTSMNTYRLEPLIHRDKADFHGVKFMGLEDIYLRNVCTFKWLCRSQRICFVTSVDQLAMKKRFIEHMIFSRKEQWICIL